jgi:hypothetical protein
MKLRTMTFLTTLSLAAALLVGVTHRATADTPGTSDPVNGLCDPLRKFVESVNPGESRVFEFHTSWGRGFKDSDDGETLAAKRCDDNGYGPAKAVCTYLMEQGAIEFSSREAKAAVRCLSPSTRFTDKFRLHSIDLSITYGTDDRGSNVDVKFAPDEHLGGMIMSITANGY